MYCQLISVAKQRKAINIILNDKWNIENKTAYGNIHIAKFGLCKAY